MGPRLSGPAAPLSEQRADTREKRREQRARSAFARGPLGTYRMKDRDYWIDVAETLDEAMDLPIPDGASSLIDARLHTALNYLHSFPSLRCHLTVRSEWYGEDTLALTEQWGRDGVDAAQEGLLIEYWLNELREIIRIIPLCVD